MNKPLIIQAIIDALCAKVDVLQESSRKTRSTGNDAESKSEGKYDTRSTEENYLADGFARQAQAVVADLTVFQNMPIQHFDATSPIDASALVQLAFEAETVWFLLAPAAGGTEVQLEGIDITVLSLDSPLGSQLIGLKVGAQTQAPVTRILAVA